MPPALPACVSWRARPAAEPEASTESGHRDEAGPAEPTGRVWMPPPSVDCGTGQAIRLDPAPLTGDGTAPSVAPLACTTGEIAFGIGCAEVEDDRLIVRPPAPPILWAIAQEGGTASVYRSRGTLFVRRVDRARAAAAPSGDAGTPLASVGLQIATADLTGRVRNETRSILLAPVRDHLVINEVLANPLGPEPAQEWIELYNDGLSTVHLEAYRLVVGSADPVALPPSELESGAFAVVASSGFQADDGTDTPVAAGALIVRLAHLGQGLSNAGSSLALVDSTGVAVSRFPARAASEAGVSIARVSPDALDDDPGSFISVASAGGRTTPGSPNGLAPSTDPVLP